ncbi:CMP/dCMP deaminase zinc-binding protein [Denitrovibrio acetiphilus DSM 12809]|uniref:tRNA-specific adenosine deaminase n=1 Tax=Denitrovibrio acetiphilus (strain DSM 12809 / NBRC 114555 / N2460) TaxID=522772 RepID=D4H7G1_DENA2|nr:nucleoside deaminase [Denitrovibrio acetiphilus]ADD67960.1 CMP/dCMP deaminase zinc-binding protein [Denitrovibrio acetiphilus DSM 12809]
MNGFTEQDIFFMNEAVKEAEGAAAKGEVPIGAVVVSEGAVIGRGSNKKNSGKSALNHAEIIAIEDASSKIGDWRLDECTLYVTLEPCLMCAGAIIHARIRNVIFGTTEPKFGGVISLARTFDIDGLNHKVSYKGGLHSDEISAMMKQFFKEVRSRKQS